jgi:signal transduction histidine kinase
MRSNPKPKFHRTLAFRLTLWYAGIFTLISCLTFFSLYLLIESMLQKRVDRSLIQRVDELLSRSEVYDIRVIQQLVTVQAQAAGERKSFIRLLYPTGVVFSSSNMAYWRSISVDRLAVQELFFGADYVFRDIYLPERKESVRVIYGATSDKIVLQIGQSVAADHRILEAFRRHFMGIMPLLILIAAGFGWFMAKRATSGLAAVIGTARRISKDDLEDRVPVRGLGDEIDQLAYTFNQMLDRIRTLVHGMREMSDNIAHDLKSPITHIRGIAEITLTNAQTPSEYEQMAAEAIGACDRLLDMINTMLAISESEAGVGRLNYEAVDLNQMIKEACELFTPLCEDKKIKLTWTIPADLALYADKRKIQRILANLIDNAIKYTGIYGKVSIAAENPHQNSPHITIRISDTGIGISEKDRPFIFDRFFRCDQSRSEAGTGLGLSLARAFARAHGGDIVVESSNEKGSVFKLTLPIRSAGST